MHQSYLLLLYSILKTTVLVVYFVLVVKSCYFLGLLKKIDAFKAVLEDFVIY